MYVSLFLSEYTQYSISVRIHLVIYWVNRQFCDYNCLMKKGKGEIRLLGVGAKFYNVLFDKDVYISVINKFKEEISSLSGISPSDDP